MFISKIYINNFRNFLDFRVQIEAFTLIVGPNNSGKTNLFIALEKILSSKSARRVPIQVSDFHNPAESIIIEVVFSNLTEDDQAVFFNYQDNFIDPEENQINLRFESHWSEEEQDILNECYFVYNGQRKTNYTYEYRKYISMHFSNLTERNKGELSLSQSQNYGKIVRAFAGDYLKPLETLVTNFIEQNQKLREQIDAMDDVLENILKIELLEKLERVRLELIEISASIPHQGEYDSLKMSSDLKRLLELFDHISDQISTKVDHNSAVIQNLRNVKLQLETLTVRIPLKVSLSRASSELKNATSFQTANSQITNILAGIFPDIPVDFQMLPLADEKLIGTVNAILEEFPIDEHGSGYQSLFDVGLGLARVIADMHLGKRSITSLTCLLIDEVELHLHPHMIRHVINQLRIMHKKWNNNQRHLQVIVSSHSPTTLSKFDPVELIQLRTTNGKIVPIKWDNKDRIFKDLAEEISPDSVDDQYKVRKQLFKWCEDFFLRQPEILFSKLIVVVEGYSELGFIKEMANYVINADFYGIYVLNAKSGKNINNICTLLRAFDLQFIVIYDGGDQHDLSSVDPTRKFPTKEKAFEKEILALDKDVQIWKAFEEYLPSETIDNIIRKSLRIETIKSVQDIEEQYPTLDKKQKDHLRNQLFQQMTGNVKGDEFGTILARHLAPNFPQSYKDALKSAEDIARRV